MLFGAWNVQGQIEQQSLIIKIVNTSLAVELPHRYLLYLLPLGHRFRPCCGDVKPRTSHLPGPGYLFTMVCRRCKVEGDRSAGWSCLNSTKAIIENQWPSGEKAGFRGRHDCSVTRLMTSSCHADAQLTWYSLAQHRWNDRTPLRFLCWTMSQDSSMCSLIYANSFRWARDISSIFL